MTTRLGEYVKQRREALGLSQRRLADKAGMSHSTLNQIEIGDSVRPNIETLEKLANALGVPLSRLTDVLQGRPVQEPTDPLAALADNLSPEGKVLAEMFIRSLLAYEEKRR